MIEDHKHYLSIQVRMNMNYHEAKESYYSRWLDIVLFINLLFSTGAVVGVLFEPNDVSWAVYTIVFFGAMVAVLNAAMIAFKVQQLAITHNLLKRRWIECSRRLTKIDENDENALSEIEDLVHQIGEDEPPPDVKKLIKAQHEAEYVMGLRENPV